MIHDTEVPLGNTILRELYHVILVCCARPCGHAPVAPAPCLQGRYQQPRPLCQGQQCATPNRKGSLPPCTTLRGDAVTTLTPLGRPTIFQAVRPINYTFCEQFLNTPREVNSLCVETLTFQSLTNPMDFRLSFDLTDTQVSFCAYSAHRGMTICIRVGIVQLIPLTGLLNVHRKF